MAILGLALEPYLLLNVVFASQVVAWMLFIPKQTVADLKECCDA
jgi:hypothetical protein